MHVPKDSKFFVYNPVVHHVSIGKSYVMVLISKNLAFLVRQLCAWSSDLISQVLMAGSKLGCHRGSC